MVQRKEVNLTKAFISLKANKREIGIATVATTLISIVYVIFATPIYTAKALINPPKLSDAGTSFSQVISGLQAISGGGGGLLAKTDADIAIAMLNTPAIKKMVIKNFNLEKLFKAGDIEAAQATLAGKVKFIPDVKSGFLEIDVDDKNPKLAAAIANFYITSLGQLINNIAYRRASQRFEFYQRQLVIAQEKLNLSESALKKFYKENGLIAGQQAQVIAGISSQLQLRLITAQLKLQEMSYYVSEDNSDYKAVQAEIASYNDQIAKLNNQGFDSDDSSIPAKLAPELANRYLTLMRDYKFSEVVYEVINKQSKAAELDSQSEVVPLAVQVISQADVPIHKSRPKRSFSVILGFMVGLILSSIYFLIRNRDQFILVPDVLEKAR